MQDLYSTLGVSKDATKEEIRKAYLEKSKKLHPDMGGDTEQFQELSLAYEVLSCPDKRSKYDKGEPVFNTINPDAFIQSRVSQVFSALVDSNFDFTHKHVFQHIISNIKASIAQIPHIKNNAHESIKRWEGIKARIHGDNSEFYKGILDSKILAARKNLSNVDKEIPILENIIKFLERTEYKVDEAPNGPRVTFTFGGTTTTF